MIIEMRTYRTKSGMRSQFLEIFRSKSIPKHRKRELEGILMPMLDTYEAVVVDDPAELVRW
jgi:hypothetical protein